MERRSLPRRRLIGAGAGAFGALLVPPHLGLAAIMAPTPTQSEGPFYPVRLPDDRDADLVRVTGSDAPPSAWSPTSWGRCWAWTAGRCPAS